MLHRIDRDCRIVDIGTQCRSRAATILREAGALRRLIELKMTIFG